MEQLPLNIVDLVVLGIVTISALIALFRGFVRELLGLFGWAAAAFIAYISIPVVAPLVEPHVKQGFIAQAVAAGLVFITAMIVFAIITHFVVKGVKAINLGGLDRTLGTLFGVVRGAFLVSLAYFMYGVLLQLDDSPHCIKEAKTGRLVEMGANVLAGMAPELADDLNRFSKQNLASLHDSPEERGLQAQGVFAQLNDKERDYANRLLKSLPENEKQHTVDDLTAMDPKEAGYYLMGLIRPYQKLQREGEVPEQVKHMSSEELVALVKALREVARGERIDKDALKDAMQQGDGSYFSHQVKELQRLVDGLQQQQNTDAPIDLQPVTTE